ncbi:Alpha/Beta hydrolase protein [Blakeslea trispora]|nr:Alpha/Beta hydrolase protein [Blakeslea trispora]
MTHLNEGEIESFEIPSLSHELKQQLQSKVQDTAWPHEFEKDYNWSLGAPTSAVKPMAEEWAYSFDWEKPRQEMNRWHHYRMKIDGLLVHYVHERSTQDENAIPIILVHGWPSTFYMYHKMIDYLRDGHNGKQSFHVIVPSLPGFGFSDAPKEKGCGIRKMASMLNKLMVNLGYERYLYHGGDWGSIIGLTIATNYNQNCKAYHTNFPLLTPPLPSLNNIISRPTSVLKFLGGMALGFDRVYGPNKVTFGSRYFACVDEDIESGYRAIQGSRPYTLSFALTDSPVGLLAWLLEKFHQWTYHPTDKKDTQALPETVNNEEFLTELTIYYMTNTISSSVRIYYEFLQQKEGKDIMSKPLTVPYAVSAFAHELMKVPKEWAENFAPLWQFNEFPVGGHFPSLEEPELLTQELQQFGAALRSKHVL